MAARTVGGPTRVMNDQAGGAGPCPDETDGIEDGTHVFRAILVAAGHDAVIQSKFLALSGFVRLSGSIATASNPLDVPTTPIGFCRLLLPLSAMLSMSSNSSGGSHFVSFQSSNSSCAVAFETPKS